MFDNKSFIFNEIQERKSFSYNTSLIFINYIYFNLLKYVKLIIVNKDKYNFNIYLKNYEDIRKIIFFLKKHTKTQYNILADIFGIDLLNKKNRYNLVYCLLSIRFNSRIRINIYVNDSDKVFTMASLFKNSVWLEREIWDMLGIFFFFNPDLRRILTDYGFEGYPLRKDFPLSGFIELRYDDSIKKIVYEPIEITQEYRFYDFVNPWDQVESLY